MQSISSNMRAALQGPHRIAARVEVFDPTEPQEAVVLPYIESGNIDIERRDIERTATIEIIDNDGTLTPTTIGDLLMPAGNEFRPYRGVAFPDGTEELVPLGTFRITSCRINYPRITLAGSDRAWVVQGARFEDVYTISKGTNVVGAIQEILLDRYPLIRFNFPTTQQTTAQLVFEAQSDPWQAVTELAATVGMRIYFDALGVCSMVAESLPAENASVWEYVEGATSLLLSSERAFDIDEVYNAVIVTGDNPSNDTPVRGMVFDNDPNSPTYYFGKFGKRPTFESSQFVANDEQAVAYATRTLAQQLGVSDSLMFPAIVNPAHEIGDIVYVRRTSARIDDYHVLDKFNVPLRAAEPMNAATRAKQVVF